MIMTGVDNSCKRELTGSIDSYLTWIIIMSLLTSSRGHSDQGEALNQCWLERGPSSTLAQPQTIIGSKRRARPVSTTTRRGNVVM